MKKQSVKKLNVKVNTLNNQVVMVNMVTFGLNLNQTQVKDLNSLTLSLVVASHVNTSNLLAKV